jgi:hypothetical protein
MEKIKNKQLEDKIELKKIIIEMNNNFKKEELEFEKRKKKLDSLLYEMNHKHKIGQINNPSNIIQNNYNINKLKVETEFNIKNMNSQNQNITFESLINKNSQEMEKNFAKNGEINIIKKLKKTIKKLDEVSSLLYDKRSLKIFSNQHENSVQNYLQNLQTPINKSQFAVPQYIINNQYSQIPMGPQQNLISNSKFGE